MHADCFGFGMHWISLEVLPVVNVICTAGLRAFSPPVPLFYKFIIYFSPTSSSPSLTSIIIYFFLFLFHTINPSSRHPYKNYKALFFTLYIKLYASLWQSFQNHKVVYKFADDNQIYISLISGDLLNLCVVIANKSMP